MIGAYIRRGFYNTFAYAIGSVFTRVISFLFLPYFLSKLSLAELGMLDLYQTIFSQGTLLFSSCAATSIVRFYLLYKDDELKQKQAVGNALLFAACGALIFFSCIGIVPFIWQSFNNFVYLKVTLLNVGFFTLFSLVLAYIRVRENLVAYLLLFCGQNFISMALTVAGVHYGYGIQSFLYGNLVSFALFAPVFVYLFLSYRSYAWGIFREQLWYSVPLVIYSVFYSSFYTLDRFFIKENLGYESLGFYSLLWRFGSIMQFFAIALLDAWPLMMFNAQKEKDGDLLISKLMAYVWAALCTLCLGTIIAARMGIELFLPEKYGNLVNYLPLFCLFVLLLETIKLSQAGFCLAAKTIYTPFFSATIVGLQTALLYSVSTYHLYAVIGANIIAMFSYIMLSCLMTKRVYTYNIFAVKKLTLISLIFAIYISFLHISFSVHGSYLYVGLALVVWALLIWFVVVGEEEKSIIYGWFGFSPGTSTGPTILYLRTDIQFSETKIGGSIAHTSGVIEGFKKAGYEVIAASSNAFSTFDRLPVASFKPLRVYPLFFFLRWKFAHLRWRLDCIFSNLFFTLQMMKDIRTTSIDFIYQRYSLLNCVGLILSKIKSVPLVLEYNGSDVWAYDVWGERTVFKLKTLSRLIEWLNLYSAHYIVVVSQVLKDDLVAKGINAQKILVNPNGVDSALFDPEKLITIRDLLRRELEIDNKFVFGFIGTFSYWHGIDIIAQMIPAVMAQKPEAHFLLIGDGPLKNMIQNFLENKNIGKKNVTFTGAILHEEAKKYLSTCDAFLCPTQPNPDGSRFFGSPTKLFEYMSLAKPIIASNIEQIGEVLSPYEEKPVGVLIEPNDINGFVQAAIKVMKNEENVLGKNAREKVVHYYSWHLHVKKIIAFVKGA